MRILLVEPEDNVKSIEREIFPSGALILIGTMLQQNGHDVSIIHMFPDKIDTTGLIKKVHEFKPEIVGITMNTFQTKSARKISQAIKKTNKNIIIVTGGPHPSALKKDIFKYFPEIDIVVYGEGEFTFLEIAEGKDLRDIKGICYDGKVNAPRPYAENLDYIPLPNLDLVGNIEKFSFGRKRRSMYIMASRGCPFQCIFCNKSVWGSRIRLRSPQHVIKEIQWLHDKYGIQEIAFQDDTFNLNKKWAEEIFRLIISSGLNKEIVYKIALRANWNLIDEKFLCLAKEAGVYLVFFGVESGNQEMLDRMKKKLTVEEIKRAFVLAHKVGLKTIASFIIGLPGETTESIRDSIKLWKQINPYDWGFTLPIPFPGTELRKILIEKDHLLNTNYHEYFLGNCLVRTDELSAKELVYYFKKLSTYKNLGQLPRKFTKYYIKNVVKEFMLNPKSLLRRIKTFLQLFQKGI